MRQDKKQRLQRAGWKVGNAKEFLGLSDADSAVVDIRVALATALKRRRLAHRVSQTTLAKRVGSSQSRVAKMETGDPSVSLDLLIRCLLISGSTSRDIAEAIAEA